jgi:MATE family, multidrug efflux pump
MVGRLGALELAAVALGDAIFFTFAVVVMGLVMSLDPLCSQAYGAGDDERCAASWRCGVQMSFWLAAPLTVVVLCLPWLLGRFGGLDPLVVDLVADYLYPRALGVLPWLLYTSDRSLLNGMGVTRPAMVVTLLANVINLVGDWVFIFGHWGVEPMGVGGSGLVTALSRWFMYGALAWWLRRDKERYGPFRRVVPLPRGLMKKAILLGAPIGLSKGAEVGAFATCSLYMGWMGVVALASHQVAIKITATAFMIAMALGIATGIRVGQAIGAGKADEAQRSGYVGLRLGLGLAVVIAILFLTAGRQLMSAFIPHEPEVIALGASLLVVAAAFQIPDIAQTVAAGALRGAGDTAWPLWAHLASQWAFAIPAGYVLAFVFDLGPLAVWWSLASGLTVAALILVWRFRGINRRRSIHAEL